MPRTEAEESTGLLPPIRSSVFSAIDNNHSSQSLPDDFLTTHSARQRPGTSSTLPIPKTPEMRASTKVFNFGSSKDQRQHEGERVVLTDTPADDGSFKLKSFRPVSPGPMLSLESMHNAPLPAPTRTVGIGPRIRTDSNASDASQRMTVAAFREAQQRARSSSHLPETSSDGTPPGNVPLPSSTARPASPAGVPHRPARISPPASFGRNSPAPNSHNVPSSSQPSPSPAPVPARQPARKPSGQTNHRWAAPDSDSDEDSDKGSVRSNPRASGYLKRGNTVTQRSASKGSQPSQSTNSSQERRPTAHSHAGHSQRPSAHNVFPSQSELGHSCMYHSTGSPAQTLTVFCSSPFCNTTWSCGYPTIILLSRFFRSA